MNDLLIQFGTDADGQRLASLLRERPGVGAHPVQLFDFPWGRVALQPPAARGYAPLYDAAARTLVACVGRPRFMGVEHEQRGDAGFNSLLRERLRDAGPRAASDALTGMFAAVECDTTGVRVLTDPMGFLPVYVGRDRSGGVVAVGTHVDSVAALAGRTTDFDTLSLADLLVNQYVTFPHTTRHGVTQLEPASLTEFEARTGPPRDVRTSVFWQPREPSPGQWPGPDELDAELEAALRTAAEEVSRGAGRVALTLSGGLDSRVVLSLLPRHKLAGAVTYATLENRELSVARQVAAAAGVPHHAAWRNEEFYAELMPRAVGLLGTELRGECHGFAIVDNGLDEPFDLFVGGFLSDTLFKGHYLSAEAKERLRPQPAHVRLRRLAAAAARKLGVLPPARVKPHYFDEARAMAARLKPDVREALAERRRVRLEQVRQVRPESAEEWLRFWPASRCDGSYGPQANTRLFTADELFMHRRLIELAARTPLREKVDGRLTRRVFPRLYGPLGKIEDAGTGLPAEAPPSAKRPRTANGNGGVSRPSPHPWNVVPHSWVDYVLLQKLSPVWQSYRATLADSPALGVLDGVFEGGLRDFVRAYHDEAGFLFNRAVIQLTYAMDRALRGASPESQAPARVGAAST
jgi:asparagine synthetase B (glutamine-hydrolysing)